MVVTAHTMLFLSLGWCLVEDMAFALAFTPLAKAAAFPLALAFTLGKAFDFPWPFGRGSRTGLTEMGDEGRSNKALFPI